MNVIYPTVAGATTHQIPANQQIVRVINHYKRLSLAQLQHGAFRTKHDSQSEDYTFIVKIKVQDSVLCSGALLAPRLVISSGSCLSGVPSSQVQILTSLGTTHPVANIEWPRSCRELYLITLGTAAAGQPIGLCSQAPKLFGNATMLMTSSDLSYFGLRHSQVVSNRECKMTFLQDETVYITPNMLCLRNSQNPEKCVTEQGDALLVDRRLCGLNVYGSRCRANAPNADLYIDLAKHRTLLTQFIQKLRD
ncbi:uncharacterized protein LOC117583483 [Drosophila guanche]|uniref:Peptidase S1 domain-containing protein n=1 Tax=Drosophila guanche TaxID=7266 RepID=A0A3B0JEH3_DROGU|nr:uncharacterized protein LOC117583483 [Drosophila guanche]SPP80784.1 Hypothetical predicted protein [Drosophila guanche]